MNENTKLSDWLVELETDVAPAGSGSPTFLWRGPIYTYFWGFE
jgi:hypothetical protein